MTRFPDTPEFRAAVAACEREAEFQACVLAAVASCPHRGPVLPVGQQGQGCLGGELSECRAGKGDVPGRVCRVRCVECKCEELTPKPWEA